MQMRNQHSQWPHQQTPRGCPASPSTPRMCSLCAGASGSRTARVERPSPSLLRLHRAGRSTGPQHGRSDLLRTYSLGYSFSFIRSPLLGIHLISDILLFYTLRSHAIVFSALLFPQYIATTRATWRLSFDLLSPGKPHCTSLVDTRSIQTCLQP